MLEKYKDVLTVKDVCEILMIDIMDGKKAL